MSVPFLMSVAALAAGVGLGAPIALAQIAVPTVPIGNPGNAADPATSRGSVGYLYSIGTTEVTNAQYAAFLNAKAASDPFNLYNTGMGGTFGGITRSGSAGSFTYSTIAGRENNPVNFVSFWDTTRFANWLNNGQGNGDTETGAYTLGGVTNPVSSSVTRNAGALWVVPTKNEWYKAAYFQPVSAGGPASNYWLHPTGGLFPTPARANSPACSAPRSATRCPWARSHQTFKAPSTWPATWRSGTRRSPSAASAASEAAHSQTARPSRSPSGPSSAAPRLKAAPSGSVSR
jgi:hypothetical protein